MYDQIQYFLINHWILSSSLLLIVILLVLEEFRSRQGSRALSPQAATQLINHEGAVIFDVRDRQAFDAGHIVGSTLMPQNELTNNMEKIKKYQEKPLLL